MQAECCRAPALGMGLERFQRDDGAVLKSQSGKEVEGPMDAHMSGSTAGFTIDGGVKHYKMLNAMARGGSTSR